VSAIAPHHRELLAPTALRELPGWLIWRYETQAGSGKQLKVPYYCDGGRRHGQQGSATDRSKLTSFAAACSAAAKRGFDGVGLAMLADWGITALDFDKCIGAKGLSELPPEIMAVVGRTYAEYSPSGEGVRAFVKGNLGNHKSLAEPGRFGFETFNSNGFVTFTNIMLPHIDLCGLEDTIAVVDDSVRSLCEARFGRSSPAPAVDNDDPFAGLEPQIGLSVEQMQTLLAGLDPDMGRDEWIRVGMALHHECEGNDTGFDLWNDWSEAGGKYPSEEALRAQWDSFTRRSGSGKRPVTMASVLKMAKEAGVPLPRPTLAASAEDLKAVAADTAEKIADLPPSEGVCTPEGFEGRFRVYSAESLAQRDPIGWLIKGVLPDADMGVLFGASGSGKSFAALDMAGSIARGVDWRGRRVRKGRVIVIAAEGGGGYGKRIKAYCQHHMIEMRDLDIGVITAAPNFLEAEDISEVVSSIVAAGGASLLIVDTFAQVTPGANENAGEDMGLALKNARGLREATGAMCLLIHHAGKDASKGARGWSGIKAAADVEIEISREEESPVRQMRTSKMKDGDDNLRWGFRLDIVDVGVDGDGDVITSCVVIETDAPSPGVSDKDRKGAKKIGRVEAHILDSIELIDARTTSMALDKFVALCVEGMPLPEDGKRDIRRQTIHRALKGLTKGADAPLIIDHGRVTFCK
jgi:hypothetical protein